MAVSRPAFGGNPACLYHRAMDFSTSTFRALPEFTRTTAVPGRFSQVRRALYEQGVDAGIAEMNAGVSHRFSGIFKLQGELLLNTCMFDKRGEARPEALETVVLSDSFCQIVMREGFFLTDHSGRDSRLDYSPFQNMVLAYHGVPILNHVGELYGTLCHFDMVEQSISDDEFMCLQETARLLPPLLK